jgi:hypothetical protein
MRSVHLLLLSIAPAAFAACSGGYAVSHDAPDASRANDATDEGIIVVIGPDSGDSLDGTPTDVSKDVLLSDSGTDGDSGSDAGSFDAEPTDSGAGCVIDGATYASGTANPTDACQDCQPTANTSAWSDLTDGTKCGSGGVCRAGVCATGSGGAGGSAGGGGGGGFGGGGGGYDSGNGGGSGSNGANGVNIGDLGGMGAGNWTQAATLPTAAGAAPSTYHGGGNAGLVILTYFDPTGECPL